MCTVGTDQGAFFWGHVLEEGTWTRSSLHAIVQPGSRSYIWALYIEQESSLPYSYQYCRQIGLVDLICVQWSINTSASGMWWEKDEYCGSANMRGSSLATRKKNVREFYDPHSWPLEYWLVLDTPLPMFFMSYQVLQTAMQSHKEEEPFWDICAPLQVVQPQNLDAEWVVGFFFLLTRLTVPAFKDSSFGSLPKVAFHPGFTTSALQLWHPVGHFQQRSGGNHWYVINPSYIEPIKLSAPSGISPLVLS